MGVEQKVKTYLEKIKKEDGKINAFLYLNPKVVEEAREIDSRVAKTEKKGKLYGYVFGVKSNINVKGLKCNCASKVLDNYYATYDATVIEKIKAEDGVIIGMTNCDEFAAGSSGENSAFGATQNPVAFGRIPGGSSSGSAASVAAGFCDVALGSDTGGSIRAPASHCGIVGVKPSYGRVSRYGLIDLSMSLDQIGVLAKNVDYCLLVMQVISGKDGKDSKTIDFGKIDLENTSKFNIGTLKINGVDKRIQKVVDDKVSEVVSKEKWNVSDAKINEIELAVETYYPIVYSEFFSGTRKFDGRRFGKKIEESCGEEILRRILGGSEITKAEHFGRYYKKALEVKELIKSQFEEAFKKFDCIVLPVVPCLPWKIGEGNKMKIEEVYASDALTIPANLAGICSIVVPAGKIEGIPVGLQIMCASGKEGKMFGIAGKFENLTESQKAFKETFGMLKGNLNKTGQQIKDECRKELYDD